MKFPKQSFCVFIVLLFIVKISHAQTTQTIQPPPSNIAIDGNIKEWGDSLRYYNKESKINFAVANTKDTLYMAIRVNDRTEQTRILRAGVTFSIDPKGKKKETFSLTFPLNTGGTAAKMDFQKDDMGEITPQEREELQKERLTTRGALKLPVLRILKTK